MGCCGQKRQALSIEAATAARPVSQPRLTINGLGEITERPVAGAVGTALLSARIRYLQSSTLYVRGEFTGRRYLFSSAQPVLTVDARDVEGLVRLRVFRREA